MNISVIPPSHILLNPSSSAQTKLNGCLNRIHHSLTLTLVRHLAQTQALAVSPAPTLIIFYAPSLVNVSILIWSVMVILSVQRVKMRT